MGRRVIPPPVSEAQYLAGLTEGRDLYAEDLARFDRRARRLRLAVFALMVFIGMVAGAIVGMVFLR